MQKINKHFISEIDKQLAHFDQTHHRSEAQRDEINKYRRVYELRDNPRTQQDDMGDIWD